MQRSLGIVAAIGLTVMPLLAAAQSPSSGARAREGFSGNLVVLNKGVPELVAVNYRTWFVPEGTRSTIWRLARPAVWWSR